MPIEPWQSFDPNAGRYYLIFERPFSYLVASPQEASGSGMVPEVLACPYCGVEEGLRLAYQLGADVLVEAQCPQRHIWVEPRIPVADFMTYGRILTGLCDPADLWLTEAGFGEAPAPPLEAEEIVDAATYVAKFHVNRAKAKVRASVRKPARKAKRAAARQAMRPVAAALRAAWNLQTGGAGAPPARTRSEKTQKKEPTPKTPPLAAYRKAYGMEAPKRGPKCLVCEDSGRITAPGISIACSECKGPAAAAMEAAERRAAKAREPKKPKAGTRGVQKVAGAGIARVTQVTGDGHQVNVPSGGPTTGRLSKEETAAARSAVRGAARAMREARGGSSSTVQIHGKNNSVVHNTVS